MTSDQVPPGQRIVRDATALVASRLLKLLTAWGVEVLLVRALAPEAWDQISRIMTVLLGAVLLGQFGFPESVLAFGSRASSDAEAKSVLWRATRVLAAIGAAVGAAFAAVPALARAVLGESGPALVLPFTVFLVSELVVAPIPSFFVARRRGQLAGVYSVVSRIPSVAGIAVALMVGRQPEIVLWGLAIGAALAAALGLGLVQRLVPAAAIERADLRLRRQLAFAAPVGLTRFAQVLHQQLDKYVVMALLPAVYGTYYLGAVEFAFVAMVCQVVGSVTMPDMVEAFQRDRRDEVHAIFSRSAEKLALIAYPMFAFVVLFAGDLFRVIYGPERADAAAPFRVFQLLLLHRFAAYGLVLQAVNRPRVALHAALITIAVNAPLSVLLTRSHGAVGAACATVGATYLSSIYVFVELRRHLAVPWRALLPYQALARTLALALASAGIAVAVATRLGSPRWALLLGGAVHVTLFLAAGAWLGVVGAPERAVLRDLARLSFLRQQRGDA